MSKKLQALFSCSSCGSHSPKWMGRCSGCGEWNTLEAVDLRSPIYVNTPPAKELIALQSVDLTTAYPHPTGIGEFDRALGGGLTNGSAMLLFGEPGIGKSTLLTQVLLEWTKSENKALLISAEEASSQVHKRAARIGDVNENLFIASTNALTTALASIEQLGNGLVVIDSIHTLSDPTIGGVQGSLAQVRNATEHLVALARRLGIPLILIGHVTKDGGLAGPRTLEHLVDTVAVIEGDRHHSLRVLRVLKHRFGPSGEIAVFQMTDCGLIEISDPGALLLADRIPDIPGSTIAPLIEGRRPVMVEIQALGVPSSEMRSKRVAQGLDDRRLSTLLGVLEFRCGIHVGSIDLFVSAVGGITAKEPGADVPLALAVTSALTSQSLPHDLTSFGEVGLAGELRHVRTAKRRAEEAVRMGAKTAIVPTSCDFEVEGLVLKKVSTLKEALVICRELSHEKQSSR